MQIDFTLHSGIAVSEEGTVFVISGGTPAGIGKNPSPMLGEILCFEDACPMDRRGDFVDLRGNGVPNPPASGGNVGDGDSDRFDHIWFQAPLDQVTFTPGGLSGLSRGFLRYTNRLAPNPIGPGVTLGVSQRILGDDDTTNAAVFFDAFDPGNQAAGGDDQNTPIRGDDNDGLGATPRLRTASIAGQPLGSAGDFDVTPNNVSGVGSVAGSFSGGFEFIFGASPIVSAAGATIGCVENVYNSFFLNSNGNITFTAGDTDNTPTVTRVSSRSAEDCAGLVGLESECASGEPDKLPVVCGRICQCE
jgi:hypothetical protein